MAAPGPRGPGRVRRHLCPPPNLVCRRRIADSRGTGGRRPSGGGSHVFYRPGKRAAVERLEVGSGPPPAGKQERRHTSEQRNSQSGLPSRPGRRLSFAVWVVSLTLAQTPAALTGWHIRPPGPAYPRLNFFLATALASSSSSTGEISGSSTLFQLRAHRLTAPRSSLSQIATPRPAPRSPATDECHTAAIRFVVSICHLGESLKSLVSLLWMNLPRNHEFHALIPPVLWGQDDFSDRTGRSNLDLYLDMPRVEASRPISGAGWRRASVL